ncbi:MAG TPA: hypothetical protein VLV78_00100 [Thermoanaerobaculia bacterium]|nr:hypothetical protein [Thermoanaerobaculia bacterium]
MLPILLFAAASTIAQLQVKALRQRTIELAPAGAFDCGSSPAPVDSIERCATEHLARKAPFFCVLAPHLTRDVVYDVRPFIEAYIGNRTGTVYRVIGDSHRSYKRVPVLGPDLMAPPVRVGGWVRAPEVIRQVRQKVRADSIRGIVIIEAIVDERGVISQTRILKPLPMKLDEIADELLRKAEVRPGTFLGKPIPVLFNFSAKVENGEITVPVIDHPPM